MKTHYYSYQLFMQTDRRVFEENLAFYQEAKAYWGFQIVYIDKQMFIVKNTNEQGEKTYINYIIAYLDSGSDIAHEIVRTFQKQVSMREKDKNRMLDIIKITVAELGESRRKDSVLDYFSQKYEFSCPLGD